jgi:xanthine dehydrogenase YagR molybdenum-binding subunit
VDYERAFDALGVSVIEEYGEWKPEGAPMDAFRAMNKGQMRMVGGPEMSDKIAYAFGAEFVEVRINRWTHEIRVPRLLGAFAAGHIMNPRTARSQLMGAQPPARSAQPPIRTNDLACQITADDSAAVRAR